MVTASQTHKPTNSCTLLALLLLILAGLLAYWNSFDGVFIYDDIPSIRDNPHIRVLWPLSKSMSLPLWSSATTVDGRPLLSLTFALNHCLLGPDPWGYHLVNLVIHIAAGLLLFGIVRRTLLLPRFRERYGDSGRWLALVAAMVWLVHPLQTESVTYIVQRAESLMGMLFLLTLYASLRAFEEERVHGSWLMVHGKADQASTVNHQPSTIRQWTAKGWCCVAFLACACGMGVKQTMFSAPLLVVLYDATFISSSLRAALTKRWRFYAALFATWLIVFGIIIATWQEATSDFVMISPIRYLFTQPLVLLQYLRLCVWPSPLILSYAWDLEDHWPRIVFPGLLILGMLAVMFRGVWQHRWYGYVTAWFFLILAPTSSLSPNRQAIFEHRMYLSLAAVVILAVVGGHYAMRKLVAVPRRRSQCGACLAILLVISLCYRTHDRNKDYHSQIGIWLDNLAHQPNSHIAHNNLGGALHESHRMEEAIDHYQRALQLGPQSALTYNNLGNALHALGRTREAIPQYRNALRVDPANAKSHYDLGNALLALGRPRDAEEQYQQALRLKPRYAKAHNNLGNAVLALGRPRDALPHYRAALRLNADYAEVHYNLGRASHALNRPQEAVVHYWRALRLRPDFSDAHYNLGNALAAQGRTEDAIECYRQAVRVDPDHVGAHNNLGSLYRGSGRLAEAVKHLEQAVRLNPDNAVASENLRQTREMAVEVLAPVYSKVGHRLNGPTVGG